jgi:hypothetical protein
LAAIWRRTAFPGRSFNCEGLGKRRRKLRFRFTSRRAKSQLSGNCISQIAFSFRRTRKIVLRIACLKN